MDRFKFRAWDKEEEKMYEVYEIHFDANHNGSVYCGQRKELDKDNNNIYPKKELTFGSNVIMACTGLKDKNGKLIYEGDIVIMPDTYTESVDVGVGMCPVAQQELNTFGKVVFKKGAFGIEINEATENYYEGFNFFEDIEDIEIIGNIYENPELLKGGE